MVPCAASRRAIVTTLTVSVVALAALHLAAVFVEHAMGDRDYFQRLHLAEIRRQFDLEQEANFATWYSSATLLLCAFLLQTICPARSSGWRALRRSMDCAGRGLPVPVDRRDGDVP